MEKRFLSLLAMLLLMVCATMLPAQAPALQSISDQSTTPVPVHIYAGSAQESATWYLEENSISNEFGETIVELQNASVDSFFSLLDEIAKENHFTAFSIDRQNTSLTLADGTNDAQSVLAELVSLLNR